MPLSSDAKSVAYRWDDLPEMVRQHILSLMAKAEAEMRAQLARTTSEQHARSVYPLIGNKVRR